MAAAWAACRRSLRVANPQQDANRMAASRKQRWWFSEGRSGTSKGGRRINNPPQVRQPAPHSSRSMARIVAAPAG
jgi:hypothetical protein